MFRTWSGPGGSSHKDPLVSVLLYSRYLCSVGLRPTEPLGAAKGFGVAPALRPAQPLGAAKGCGTSPCPLFFASRTEVRVGEKAGQFEAPQPFSLTY